MSADLEGDIGERFRRKIERRDRAIGTQRIGDLNKIFAWRYGGNRESYIFPEDDAGLEDLKILLRHYALNNPLAMPRIIELRAPWMSEAAATSLLEQIEAFPQKWRADTLGRKLNLTGAEWRTLANLLPPASGTSVDTIKILKATTRPVPPSTGMGGEDGWPSGTAVSRTADARSLQFSVKLELEPHACVTGVVPEAGRDISETHIRTGQPGRKPGSEELHKQTTQAAVADPARLDCFRRLSPTPVSQFAPWLRFQSSLVKPGMQISRTRLSLVPSGLRSWQAIASSRNVEEPERVVQVVLRVLLEASSATSSTSRQPVPQAPLNVEPDEVVGLHHWPLVEVVQCTCRY
jgi:hypothetical protein